MSAAIRRLKIMWWVLTALLLGWAGSLYMTNPRVMHHHITAVVISILWLATFPMGVAVSLIVGSIFGVLRGSMELPRTVEVCLGGTAISAAGFYQWFYLTPRLVRAWRQRHQVDAEGRRTRR